MISVITMAETLIWVRYVYANDTGPWFKVDSRQMNEMALELQDTPGQTFVALEPGIEPDPNDRRID